MSFTVTVPRQFDIPVFNDETKEQEYLRFPGAGSYEVDDSYADHPVLRRFKTDGKRVVKAVPMLAGAAPDPNATVMTERQPVRKETPEEAQVREAEELAAKHKADAAAKRATEEAAAKKAADQAAVHPAAHHRPEPEAVTGRVTSATVVPKKD
jgi:hypothetical protein